MRSVLIVNDLWGFVSGETVLTEHNEAEWKTKEWKSIGFDNAKHIKKLVRTHQENENLIDGFRKDTRVKRTGEESGSL